MAIKTTTSSTEYIDKIKKDNVDTNDLTFSCGGVTVFQHPAQLTMNITTPSGVTAQSAIHSISVSRTNSQEPFLVANGLSFNGTVSIGASGAVVAAPQNNFSNPQNYLFVGDELKITANLNSGYWMSNSITTGIINDKTKSLTFNPIYSSYTITFYAIGAKTSIVANITYTRPDGQSTILTKSGRIFTIQVKPNTSYFASFWGKHLTCYPATIERTAEGDYQHSITVSNSSPFTPITPTEASDINIISNT